MSCTERLQASTSLLFFEWTKKHETTKNRKPHRTIYPKICLYFFLTKNREPGAKKGKPRTARNTKPGEPKHAKTEKLALKRWLKPKLPTPPLVRRNFVMSESGNVKVNQPDFLVKVGNMLDMVGIPAVIMILWDKQLKMRLFNFFSSQFYTLIASRRGLKPVLATNSVQTFIRVPALTRTSIKSFLKFLSV